jgi:ribonuclease HI
LLHGYGGSSVVVRGDSQLVIRQLAGTYGVHTERLKPLFRRAQELLSSFRATLEWVPRELNVRADELSKRAYVEYLDKHPELVEQFKPFLATEKQLMFLRKLGAEPHKYMSKAEASRLIRNLLRKRGFKR